jgi:hypothetical protein
MEMKYQNIVFLYLNKGEMPYAFLTTAPKKELNRLFKEHVEVDDEDDDPHEIFYPRGFQESVIEAGYVLMYVNFPIINFAEFDKHQIK